MKTLEIMFKIKSAMFKPMLDICRQVSTALVGVLVRIRSSAATLCLRLPAGYGDVPQAQRAVNRHQSRDLTRNIDCVDGGWHCIDIPSAQV